jgi:hypothetical protein
MALDRPRSKSAAQIRAGRLERLVKATLARTGVPDPKSNNSRITNGERLFITGGSNTAVGRRYRDLYAAYRLELGRPASVIEDTLLRSAASMAVRQEQLAGALSAGDHISAREITQLSSELRRVLRELGIGNGAAKSDKPDPDRQSREAKEAGL